MNPNLNYTVIHCGNKETYIIATQRFENYREVFKKKLKAESFMRMMGVDFAKFEVEDLFSSRKLKICFDTQIRSKAGSGINPVCPAHFIDDIKIAQVNNLN